MALVSITRARLRSIRFLPTFALSAMASIRQAQAADGFLGGALLQDRRFTFWTLTVWTDEAAMRAYMLAGAHRAAMPKFMEWCDEASVIHWNQAETTVPPWSVATQRMRAEGRPSKVRKPSRDHQAMTYAAPRLTHGGPIAPTR